MGYERIVAVYDSNAKAKDAAQRALKINGMLAEAHKAELQVKAFDLDYSWPLHSALTKVLQGQAPASVLREEWE